MLAVKRLFRSITPLALCFHSRFLGGQYFDLISPSAPIPKIAKSTRPYRIHLRYAFYRKKVRSSINLSLPGERFDRI